MKQNARIITYGYWGTNRPAFSFALTGARMMADAFKYGRVRGLTRYRDDGKDDKSKSKNDDPGGLPIGLSRSSVFPSGSNVKSAWSNLVGGVDYLEQYPNPFGGNISGLGHTSDAPAAYSGVSIPENTGHILRLYLHKAPENVTNSITTANWQGFQFQIAEGDTVLQRLAPTWTQANETALFGLLGVKERSIEQQAQVDELQRTLYEDATSLSLNSDGDKTSGSFYELEFIPEECGKVSVYSGGKLAGVLDHTPILKTRKPGVLWGASPLVIRRNGGHFVWQCGFPWFSSTGEIRFPYRINYELDPLENYELDPLENMVFNKVASTPAGTSIVLSQAEETSEIVASFSTSNQRKTPFLYLAQAYLDAGKREGSMAVSFDTDQKLDSRGNAPILEIEPQVEGELRRAQFNVQVRDIQGALFSGIGSHFYEALENRVCDLIIGGQAMMRRGIVRSATISDWGSALAGQARSNVARAETTAQLEFCDPWALLEEHELEGGELVGDGLRLGALFRRGLRRIGTPYSEMSGIADGAGFNGGLPLSTAGRVLPSAAMGEPWAVVNGPGTLADFFYYLIERFGMGRILWRNGAGTWNFGPRPTTTRVLNGHQVHFSSDPARNHPDSWPGRFAMLRPIDLPRDMSDFFNKYRVRGAEGVGDEPLVREWTICESIDRGEGSGSRKFIGREKRMRTIEDNNLRTADEMQYSLRSAVELHGRPPRFLAFETYFHSGLFINDPVKADTGNYALRRISGGSWKDDTMNLLLQETGY